MIAAAAGARVAKHGNRSVSSLCGSADVLEVFNCQSLIIPILIDSLGIRGPHFTTSPKSGRY